MADNEVGDLEDHHVPADLLELYEVLEYTGKIAPPKAPPQMRSLSGDQRIISRAAWGARAPRSRTGLSDPEGNTAHWTGAGQGGSWPHSSCYTKVRGIQAFHMDGRKWSDIAYTSMECPHGYIFVCRWWNTRTAANGTNAGNDRSYAHCYLGGEGDPFTDDGKRAMRDVFDMSVATGAGGKRWPHSHWTSTSCPGPDIPSWLNAGMPVPGDTQPADPSEPPPSVFLEDTVPTEIMTVVIPTTPAGQPNAGCGWVSVPVPKDRIIGVVSPGIRPENDGYYETCEVGVAANGDNSVISVVGWAPGHEAHIQISVAR